MPRPDDARAFYDELADVYHLLYGDWRREIARQGAVLDRLIRSLMGDGATDVLDCTAGIGTQAIGLARRGYRVHATDVSAASIDRARSEAQALEIDVSFGVADMRDLAGLEGRFDVVVACDNPMPHLPGDADLGAAIASMRSALRPGGLLLTTLADHDASRAARPPAGPARVFEEPGGRRVVLMLYDWAPDGGSFEQTVLIAREREGDWTVRSHRTTTRALLRAELGALLEAGGLSAIRWHMPPETGFFQPIVTARAPKGPAGGPAAR